jgi:hypothetical protein
LGNCDIPCVYPTLLGHTTQASQPIKQTGLIVV